MAIEDKARLRIKKDGPDSLRIIAEHKIMGMCTVKNQVSFIHPASNRNPTDATREFSRRFHFLGCAGVLQRHKERLDFTIGEGKPNLMSLADVLRWVVWLKSVIDSGCRSGDRQ